MVERGKAGRDSVAGISVATTLPNAATVSTTPAPVAGRSGRKSRSNANASSGGNTLKNSGIVNAMLTIRVGIVKIAPFVNRQKQDFQDSGIIRIGTVP